MNWTTREHYSLRTEAGAGSTATELPICAKPGWARARGPAAIPVSVGRVHQQGPGIQTHSPATVIDSDGIVINRLEKANLSLLVIYPITLTGAGDTADPPVASEQLGRSKLEHAVAQQQSPAKQAGPTALMQLQWPVGIFFSPSGVSMEIRHSQGQHQRGLLVARTTVATSSQDGCDH